MEFLFVLLSVVLILLLVSIKNSLKNRLLAVETELRRLREQMALKTPEKAAGKEPLSDLQPAPASEPAASQPWRSGFSVVKEPTLAEGLTEMLQNTAAAAPGGPVQEKKPVADPIAPPPPAQAKPPAIVRPPKPSFLERNPDLEKFIGENLISKIGIGILVLAIGFFVKYAIDNDWIGPAGRVAIGIGFGGILIWVGHRLRNGYKGFSSVLVGGGFAIFYFTITLAFHQFHLFSQTVSFVIMVVITAFAVTLSYLYDRQELAVIALIGGFATPFMVSQGSGNYKALFSYLIILNAGLLVIAYSKAWRILNLLAFLFTVILFGSWLAMLEGNTAADVYRNGLMFATVFFLLFFIINIAHNIRENKKFIASDFGILLSNTCLFFAAGLYCLTAMRAVEFRGLFTASMAVFNLAASYILFRNKKTDANILYLLIGITLSFISLTAPIQLNGASITMFWATECVLLYWLYQRSRIAIIRPASLLVWIAMLISLLMDWAKAYPGGAVTHHLPVIFNNGFITAMICALACYFLFVLRKGDTAPGTGINIFPGKQTFRIAGLLLLYVGGALEIGYQFATRYPATNLQLIYLLGYSFAFVLLFSFITEKYPVLRVSRTIHIFLMSLFIIIYLFSIPGIFSVQRIGLEGDAIGNHFIAQWLAALLLAAILYRLTTFIREHGMKNNRLVTWLLCVAVIIFLSAEVHLLANSLFYDKQNTLRGIQRVYVKTGLPILWGLCSFGFMWVGMRLKHRILRIISLTLFSVILFKLFLFDIRNIPVAGKIAAFFSLGILLLVVSFMYQRLKKIIVEDEKKPAV